MLTGLASAGSVLYAGPVTWPGQRGRSGQHGMPLTCAGDPGQANPGPDEPLTLPDTPLYAPSAIIRTPASTPRNHGPLGVTITVTRRLARGRPAAQPEAP